MAVDFPSSPTSGQVFSVGGASWRYNGYAWARIPDPGEKGQKGQKGDKGQKGEKGIQGDKGIQGNFGGATFDYTFSDATGTPTDLNTGRLRFNNSSVSSATIMFIDDEDDNGTDIQPFLRTIDDSTSTIKGHVRISNKLNADDFALFTISSATEQSGFHQVSVGYVSGSATSFTNGEDIIVTFARTGDQGQKGDKGIQGIQGVQDKIFEGNTEAEVVDTGTDGHFKVKTEGVETFRVTKDGQVTTRGATGTSFNNLGQPDFGSFLVVNGGHTQNEFGILSLEGNTTTSDKDVGNIQFINQGNSNSSSGVVATSRLVARIDARIETTDNNAGNDSGGFLRFITKPESAQVRESFRIGSSGQIGLSGANYGTSGQVLTSQGVSSAPIWDDLPASITYTLPDTGTDGTNFTDARGSATITLTGTDSTTDAVVITAGDNVKITNTGSGGFTINSQDTNTTYTLPDTGTDGTNFTDARGSATITLSGSDSTTDAVVITAGDNIKITDTGSGGFTINAQNTEGDNTTYLLKAQQVSGSNNNPNLLLDASGSGTDDTVRLMGSGSVAVARNDDGQITISGTTYELDTANGDNVNEEKITLGVSGGGDTTADEVILAVSTGLSIARDTTTGKITLTNTDTGSGSNTFIGLTDTPSSFTANKTLKVNSSGNAVIFADDQNTTYDLSVPSGTTKIRLDPSDASGNDDIEIVGSGSVTVSRVDGNKLEISGTDNNTQIAINNNADNRIITGSDTANTLNAESNLTYDGSVLKINGTGQALLTLRTTDNTSDRGIAFQNSGNSYVASINVEDAGSNAADLVFHVDDTQNTNLSLVEERLRIKTTGALGLNGANYGTSGQVLTSQGSGSAPTWTTQINTQLTTEQVEDIVGDMFNSNTETRITATYADNGPTGRGKINLVVDDMTSDTNTKYDLVTSTSGDNIKLKLDASTGSGDDDDITITAGDNVTLSDDSGGGFTIATSATLTGTIDKSNTTKITTASGTSENEYHNITFVPIATANNSYQTLEIDSQDDVLAYNPHANKLRTRNLQVNRIYTSSGDSPGTSGQLLTSGGTGDFTWTNASSVGTDTYASNLSFSSGTLTLTLTDSSTLTTTIPLSGITGGFKDLDDTPSNYTNDAHKYVRVNKVGTSNDGDGLEFVTAASVGGDISYDDLQDLPTLFDGNYNSLSNTPTIPTNNNQLTNGAGYITSFTNTTYQLKCTITSTGTNPSGPTEDPYLFLDASSGSDDSVQIVGGTNVTVNRNNDGKLTISSTDTNTNTTYTAGSDYGMTLSGTEFRLKSDRRRNSNTVDIRTGNTHDYTFYDASHGIRWYTSGSEEMRLENDGDLHVDGDIIAFSTTISDIRLKKDLQIIQNPLDIINKINGYTFTYKKDNKKSAGVVAQEVEKVFPQAVLEKGLPFSSEDEENPDNYKTVEYDQIVGLLVQAVKELTDKVKKLEGR